MQSSEAIIIRLYTGYKFSSGFKAKTRVLVDSACCCGVFAARARLGASTTCSPHATGTQNRREYRPRWLDLLLCLPRQPSAYWGNMLSMKDPNTGAFVTISEYDFQYIMLQLSWGYKIITKVFIFFELPCLRMVWMDARWSEKSVSAGSVEGFYKVY